ncbi:hypothetical protein B0H10DRAFT_1943194 [Mycena sp. CBHHK59/15]|nr:hypothetical protein B0H10DRAFT_1943194 [Mycena sp. CBHHK59/15]
MLFHVSLFSLLLGSLGFNLDQILSSLAAYFSLASLKSSALHLLFILPWRQAPADSAVATSFCHFAIAILPQLFRCLPGIAISIPAIVPVLSFHPPGRDVSPPFAPCLHPDVGWIAPIHIAILAFGHAVLAFGHAIPAFGHAILHYLSPHSIPFVRTFSGPSGVSYASIDSSLDGPIDLNPSIDKSAHTDICFASLSYSLWVSCPTIAISARHL